MEKQKLELSLLSYVFEPSKFYLNYKTKFFWPTIILQEAYLMFDPNFIKNLNILTKFKFKILKISNPAQMAFSQKISKESLY